MSNVLVLVTGAGGGQQGKTGRHVSEMLLARGVPVRAFVHKIDERSDRLRALGADVVEGDFLDFHSVQRAVRDVSTVYFAYPVQTGLLEATAIMADAARKAGVTRLLDMVMLISSPDAPTPRMRQNYLSEQIFEWAGIGAAHVRATVFYENVRSLTGSSLAKEGTILLPWGSDSTVIPLVSGEDVARVAAALLTAPSVPPGSSYPVIGEVLALRDIVATFSRVLGREVRYHEIPDELWYDGALQRGLNQHAVEHLSQLWRSIRTASGSSATWKPTATIETLGGRKPKTFEEFVREEKSTLMAEPTKSVV
jgi:uncharacterized protein YbjT (DUF2867 family)